MTNNMVIDMPFMRYFNPNVPLMFFDLKLKRYNSQTHVGADIILTCR